MPMKTTNVASTVAPPPAGTNDLRPLKPLADIPIGWWPWAAGLLSAMAMAALWSWLRRHRVERPVPAIVIPPHVRARQRLEQALSLISDPRLFCIAVSDATRLYLEERFDLHAPERTTEEFLQELRRTHHLNSDQKLTLGEFLEQCDLVKFARFEPTETELRSLHRIAERLIDETAPALAEIASPGQGAALAPNNRRPAP
ncbi:MAG: hypothetical protein HY299_07155 [Verrucomicrobia bacterium]|nr:hypothetical protein [Verrucomicrobiota bacterium]